MFLDKVKITIKAGNGGNGKVSFYRSKQVMYGGPDGGDGGKGGDIIFTAKENLNTLYSFKFKRKFTAENGNNGESNLKSGKGGKNLNIEVPVGTIIKNAQNGKVLADLNEKEMECKILSGGAGGKGNTFFKSSTRRSPNFSQTGEITKIFEVELELKTIADVGLVGMPNVGKSTFLSVISNARPKIADYPFTTLTPNLGVVAREENSFVVADIPGLIGGASEGVGLGHEFLKHIERVRMILHMIDISENEGRDAYTDYKTINIELKKYSKILYKLPQIIVLTKCDLLKDTSKIENFKNKLKKKEKVFEISSITNLGVDDLIKYIIEKLSKIPKSKPYEIEQETLDEKDKTSIEIIRQYDGVFVISGGLIENMIRGIVLSDPISFSYFQKRLKSDGILDLLRKEGAKNGDIIRIKDIEFEFID